MSKTISHLCAEFVDAFPTRLEQGVLYISIPYRTTGHLCCCGCNEEVVAPLSPAQWSLTYDGQAASLHPSIGNWALPCQSHYWIHGGKVHWSRNYTGEEIKTARLNDRAALGGNSIGSESWALRLWRRMSRR